MPKKSNLNHKAVYVVDGSRTPFLKARASGPFTASDLAVATGKQLLARQPFSPKAFDQMIIGTVLAKPEETNIARMIALRLGCGKDMPAFTVMRNCASGMQALDSAALEISSGRSDLILAGGTEAMSHAPLLFNQKMTDWLTYWYGAKNITQRLLLLLKIRPSFLKPTVALLKGLTDPIVGLNMGQTAEEVAYRFGITREQMDDYAVSSHLRLAQAYANQTMGEITPIIDSKGNLYSQDNGMRSDSTVEKLTKLPPFFDKKYGMITAANSSQITDGACLLVLASVDAIKKYKLPVLGRIVDSQWAALEPSEMGLGPVYASAPILKRHHLTPDDIDTWEINEAFAAQVLGCVAAWNQDQFCQQELGLSHAIGAPSLEKINPEGGAIAVGHPIGASGARIVLHALENLKINNTKKAMAAICIGGGQGGAMYLERVSEVNEHE